MPNLSASMIDLAENAQPKGEPSKLEYFFAVATIFGMLSMLVFCCIRRKNNKRKKPLKN